MGWPTGQVAVQVSRFQGDVLEGEFPDLGGQVHLGGLPGPPDGAFGRQGGKGRPRRQGQGAGAGGRGAESDIHPGLGESPLEGGRQARQLHVGPGNGQFLPFQDEAGVQPLEGFLLDAAAGLKVARQVELGQGEVGRQAELAGKTGG